MGRATRLPGFGRAALLAAATGAAVACNANRDRGGAGGSIDRNWAQWPAPNSAAEVEAGAPNRESYTDHGDGTVSDNVTGLLWQQAVPTTLFTWSKAAAYCASLSLAGHGDWRLPTYVELVSLVDYSLTTPAIDPTYFPRTPADFFWSSTPLVGMPNGAWFVNFTTGSSSDYPHNDVSNTYYARCVR